MGKISPVSAKYIINSQIQIEGIVEKPDVIGAVFGQTEGLLGTDLELRELQRSGRIGRIEVNLEVKNGKTSGTITIPSSLDKAETAVIAAAMETIQKIGPCDSKVEINSIEDVRISKRSYVLERAKSLLKTLEGDTSSHELTEEVSHSVREMDLREFGKDRLAAGPDIENAKEIIVVEGRADVINLLRNGFKNIIATNGLNAPPTIAELAKEKELTLFVDGDRGGDLLIKAIANITKIAYVAKAPDGKEVEEITKKEIHQALRNKISYEHLIEDANKKEKTSYQPRTSRYQSRTSSYQPRTSGYQSRTSGYPPRTSRYQSGNRSYSSDYQRRPYQKKVTMSETERKTFKKMSDDLMGTRGAYILDQDCNILGKVPNTELVPTVKSLRSGIYAVITDGQINSDIARAAESVNVKYLVGNISNVSQYDTKVSIVTAQDL